VRVVASGKGIHPFPACISSRWLTQKMIFVTQLSAVQRRQKMSVMRWLGLFLFVWIFEWMWAGDLWYDIMWWHDRDSEATQRTWPDHRPITCDCISASGGSWLIYLMVYWEFLDLVCKKYTGKFFLSHKAHRVSLIPLPWPSARHWFALPDRRSRVLLDVFVYVVTELRFSVDA